VPQGIDNLHLGAEVASMWHDQGRKRAPQREKLLLIHLGVMLYPTKSMCAGFEASQTMA
jgi:hypothetical protein